MKKTALFFLLVLLFAGCTTIVETHPTEAPSHKVKNVILMIGDGMGLSQLSSAFYYQEGTPNFKRFENIGLIRTSSARQKITDSAAGATAFSTGKKTYNSAIGMDVDTVPVPTLNEILFKKGWKTGVIATSSVTHATPASFFAHVKFRSMQDEIAAQLAGSDLHFVAGGGRKFFSGNIDGLNSLESLEKAGFTVNTKDLMTRTEEAGRYVFLLDEEGMPRMLDGRGNFLGDATTRALDYFSLGDAPFFVMIEGSQIDWGGHINDADYIITEVQDFDKVIGQVLDFADQNGETLVIVTADHETGGFTLASEGGDYDRIKGSFSTKGHSTTLIPVFAYGPGSDTFRGIYENNEIFHKIMALIEE